MENNTYIPCVRVLRTGRDFKKKRLRPYGVGLLHYPTAMNACVCENVCLSLSSHVSACVYQSLCVYQCISLFARVCLFELSTAH